MPDTVLLVEDNELVRDMAIEVLEAAGLSVVPAASAHEALNILAGWPNSIGLLLTDVRLPGYLDGLQLARETRERWPHIKVIVTSGTFDKATDAVPAGAQFLPKPWLPQDMLAMVIETAGANCGPKT